ncbi:MAG: hypothetical protein O4808_22215 [Trichodesmium sp. St17_bin3_1_1]|nr:hypothetical protein [Trichodesmium sp. St17_bin3_1_1]
MRIGIVKTYKILPSVLVKNVRISRRADNWYVRFKPTFRTTELYYKKLQDNIYLIKYSYLWCLVTSLRCSLILKRLGIMAFAVVLRSNIAPGNYFSPLLLYTNDATRHE